jgi:CheY-like chemotaxis protein
LLPAVDAAPETAAAAHPASGQLTGSETVLLVEDEPAVRTVLGVALRDQGYRVLEADNGRAALRLCQDHAGPIHLALVDLIMPEMGGQDLIRQLAPRYPHLKACYISGYTEQPVDLQKLPGVTTRFLQKPFASDALLRTLRELLDGR